MKIDRVSDTVKLCYNIILFLLPEEIWDWGLTDRGIKFQWKEKVNQSEGYIEPDMSSNIILDYLHIF